MMRDAINALREAILTGERIAQLSREVAEQSKGVRGELDTIHGDMRELRDRVSRIEGGLAMIDRLRLSGPDR